MTKKEKHIKEVNIKELKANYRTGFVIVAVAFLVIGLVAGYFTSINVITDSQAKAINVVSSLIEK